MGGGACDVARAASVVLDEFRAGRLGRITLEAAFPEKQGPHAGGTP